MVSCLYFKFNVSTKCWIVVSSVACRYIVFVCLSEGVREVFCSRIYIRIGGYVEVL